MIFLAFCKFLETANACELPLSDIYPVWFTVRKVTVFKQWSLTAARERQWRAGVWWCLLDCIPHTKF